MARLLLLAPLAALHVAAETLTMPSITSVLGLDDRTATYTGPDTTITVAVPGFESIGADSLGHLYGSVIDVDDDSDATTLSFKPLAFETADQEFGTITFGPDGFTTVMAGHTMECAEDTGKDVMSCSFVGDESSQIVTKPSLSDMYVHITVTAGLDLLESSTPEEEEEETGESDESVESEDGDDENAAGAGAVARLLVAGAGAVAAVVMM